MHKNLKVRFTPMPTSFEAEVINHFLGSDWAKYVIKRHPSLRPTSKIIDPEARKKEVLKYLREYRKTNAKTLKATTVRFQREWDRHGDKILSTLREIVGTEWPEDRHHIEAMVSLNPICPRFLQTWSFTISIFAYPSSNVRRIVAHEVSHFLHFKKLQEMRPKIDPKKFERPNPEWLLSELAAVAVLNDPRIQKYLGTLEKPYAEHRKLKIGKKTAPAVINDLYRHSIKNGKGYQWFITEGSKVVSRI